MKLLVSKKINLNGFIKGNKIEYLMREYLLNKNIKDISDYQMKIAIPIVDVRTGEIVYYTNSNLRHIEEICNDDIDKMEDFQLFMVEHENGEN